MILDIKLLLAWAFIVFLVVGFVLALERSRADAEACEERGGNPVRLDSGVVCLAPGVVL